MAQIFVTGLQRRDVVLTGAGSKILAFPGDMAGPVTLVAKSSSAGANNVEMTYSSEADIQAGSADWVAVDASLTNVGSTRVAYAVLDTQGYPTAFRATWAAGTFEFAVQGIRA